MPRRPLVVGVRPKINDGLVAETVRNLRRTMPGGRWKGSRGALERNRRQVQSTKRIREAFNACDRMWATRRLPDA